jgi:hypothetical protein
MSLSQNPGGRIALPYRLGEQRQNEIRAPVTRAEQRELTRRAAIAEARRGT